MVGEVFIRHLGQIGELSEDDKQGLLELRGDTREVQRGEDVLRVGDRPTHAVVILSGFLQRYTMSAQGSRQIHSVYIPTDTPCLETLHMDVMDNALAAVAASRIAYVPHPELFRVMDAHPNVRALIWRETLVQASVFREWLMRNSQKLAHVQMAHLFCEIMLRSKMAGLSQDDTCDLPMTQEDLADALGMSTVHVNRTLMVLRAAELLDFRQGKLTVKDWNKLVEVAEFDPGYLHFHRSASQAVT